MRKRLSDDQMFRKIFDDTWSEVRELAVFTGVFERYQGVSHAYFLETQRHKLKRCLERAYWLGVKQERAKHVAPIKPKNLSKEELQKIYEAEGTGKEIAARFGIPQTRVSSIKRSKWPGESYEDFQNRVRDDPKHPRHRWMSECGLILPR